MVLAKITIVALLCPLLSAAQCADGSCMMEDETSLLQKQQSLQPGVGRATEAIGEADRVHEESEPLIARAFKVHEEQAEAHFVPAAEDHIAFVRGLADSRRVAKDEAEDEIADAENRMEATYVTDKENMDAAAERAAAAAKADAEEVRRAKINTEETASQEHQVKAAAIEGEIAGLHNGERNAHARVTEAEEEAMQEAHQRRVEEHRAAVEARHAAEKARIRAHNEDIIADMGEAADGARIKAAHAEEGMAIRAKALEDVAADDVDDMNSAANKDAGAWQVKTAGEEEGIRVATEMN